MPPKRPAKEEPSGDELLHRFCESYKCLKASVDTATAKDDEINRLRDRYKSRMKELCEEQEKAKMREKKLKRDFEKAERSWTVSWDYQKDKLEKAASEKKKLENLLHEAQEREVATLKELDRYKRRMRETLDEA